MKVREIKVTARNQITIPYDIRAEIKWFKPGAPIKVIVKDKDTIVLQLGKVKQTPKKADKRRRKKTTLLRKFVLKDEYDSIL